MKLICDIFLKLLNMGNSAAVIILIILGLRISLKKISKRAIPILWSAAAIKLVFPLHWISKLSKAEPEAVEKSAYILSQNSISFSGESIAAGNVGISEKYIIIAAYLWIAGMIVFLVYTVVKNRRLNKTLKTAVLYVDNIWFCDHIDMPFVKGLFSPRVYLPSDIDREDMPYILRHERIHMKRHDNWVKTAGFVLLIVYWFQPMCWVAYLMLARDLELACDEAVVDGMKKLERKRYAGILLKFSTGQADQIVSPLAFGYTGLKRRVKAVLNKKKKSHYAAGIVCVLSLVVILCAVVSPITLFASADTENMAQILYEKVQDADLTQEERNELYEDLLEQGYDAEDIVQLESLERNESGQLYGPDAWNAELIAVTSDQGKEGYCYREDLYEYDGVNSPEDAVKYMEEGTDDICIPVYAEDGSTVIGTFTMN